MSAHPADSVTHGKYHPYPEVQRITDRYMKVHAITAADFSYLRTSLETAATERDAMRARVAALESALQAIHMGVHGNLAGGDYIVDWQAIRAARDLLKARP